MSAENRLQVIDLHSHWSTRRGYPLQTEAELAQQESTWRSKPAYRTEAEMAEDFRDAGVRVILDFGYTKYLPIEEANRIHDYGFATQQTYPDVIIGNWVHFQPELGTPALIEFRRCLERGAGLVGLAVSGSGGRPASDPAWEPFYRLWIPRPQARRADALARASAHALPEGKCWRFYPPAGPLQAALRRPNFHNGGGAPVAR